MVSAAMVSGTVSVTGAWWPVAIVASDQDWVKDQPARMAEMRHVAEKSHRMPEAVERNGEVATKSRPLLRDNDQTRQMRRIAGQIADKAGVKFRSGVRAWRRQM